MAPTGAFFFARWSGLGLGAAIGFESGPMALGRKPLCLAGSSGPRLSPSFWYGDRRNEDLAQPVK
jgi:hypothetical protein